MTRRTQEEIRQSNVAKTNIHYQEQRALGSGILMYDKPIDENIGHKGTMFADSIYPEGDLL